MALWWGRMSDVDLRYLACTARHPLFYDTPWAGAAVTLRPLAPLVDDLPRGWVVSSREPWTIVTSPRPVPMAGWKIHVASRPDEIDQVLPVVIDYCVQTETSFKFLTSVGLVQATQSKYAELTAAGKVIVLYPPTAAASQAAVEHLRDVLSRFRGARIPGDIPVLGTPIGLRFGAYLHSWTRDEQGQMVPAVHTSRGIVHDDRRNNTPHPEEPDFITELRHQAALHDAANLLPISHTTLLHRSNAGGVYKARWRETTDVVIKEARHHTGYDAHGTDAVTRLAHEYAVLQRLAGTGHAPQPIELTTVGSSEDRKSVV